MELYDGKRMEEALPKLKPGTIRCGEKWVECDPIQVDGSACFIAGKIDSLIEFDDGSWGILDFKTTETSPEKAVLYSRQLHAYAHCFEHPAANPQSVRKKPPALSPITTLGILCFEPSKLTLAEGQHAYQGEVKWIDIPRDDQNFLSFVGETMKILDGPIPEADPKCNWCKYAQRMSSGDFEGNKPVQAPPSQECPECGAPMAERNGKYGNFWGCTKYPECKGTRKMEQ